MAPPRPPCQRVSGSAPTLKGNLGDRFQRHAGPGPLRGQEWYHSARPLTSRRRRDRGEGSGGVSTRFPSSPSLAFVQSSQSVWPTGIADCVAASGVGDNLPEFRARAEVCAELQRARRALVAQRRWPLPSSDYACVGPSRTRRPATRRSSRSHDRREGWRTGGAPAGHGFPYRPDNASLPALKHRDWLPSERRDSGGFRPGTVPSATAGRPRPICPCARMCALAG